MFRFPSLQPPAAPDSSRTIGIFENLVRAAAGLLLEQGVQLQRGYIHCSTSGVGDGDLCPANWFQTLGIFSPLFRWQRNEVKAWGAGPSVAADVIKSLVC